MPSQSSSAPPKGRGNAGSQSGIFDSRRGSEFTGVLLSALGLLVLLGLASYQPFDPSLNTSVASWSAIHNWIGAAGSYAADALFQAFGWVAYVVPAALLVVGARRVFVRPFESPWSKASGLVLLGLSLACLLDLFPFTPPVAGLIRGSGLVGYLAAPGR